MEEITTASDFSINGEINLSQLASEHTGIILLFSPYPNSQITKLILKSFNHYYHKIKGHGYEIVTVMSTDPQELDILREEYYLSFPIVNDLDGQIILDYELIGQESFSIYPQPLRRIIIIDSSMTILRTDDSIVPSSYVENLLDCLSEMKTGNLSGMTNDREAVNN